MPGLGTMMAGGAAGRRGARHPHEFFPTKPEVTVALLDAERRHLPSGVTVWEPACGDGAICRVLAARGFGVVASDLGWYGFTDCGARGGVDFLTTARRAADVLITNPPFSRAEDFVRHARALGVAYLALVLKATWWHAAERLALWDEGRPCQIYACAWRVDFLDLGAPVMEACLCVWRRLDRIRCGGDARYRPLRRPGPERMAGLA